MDYLLTRNTALEYFYLHGANLLREDKWHAFLTEKGAGLRGLQVYYTDLHFGDETIALLRQTSPELRRLKVENNQKVTGVGVEAAGDLPNLQHLGFQLLNPVDPSAVTEAVSKCGQRLQTLSLKVMPLLDDTVLRSIHDNCRVLTKLRLTDSEHMTDEGFARMFTGWENPPLDFIDLQKCRHMDSTRPRDNPNLIGLCGEGFRALMAHSGSKLKTLNVHGCRHIDAQAFEDVFSKDNIYPELTDLEISFCENVNDFILGSIFRSCPKIKKVNVFGCMKVREIVVPRGVVLIGVPNAQGMITQGDA
jgi:DNA repair protein RAD7